MNLLRHTSRMLNTRSQAARQSPDQIFKAYYYALDGAKHAEACLDAVSAAAGGRCPDALFLCAGKSRPGFWIERTEEELRECMEETYWVQAWPALVSPTFVPFRYVQQRRPSTRAAVSDILDVLHPRHRC